MHSPASSFPPNHDPWEIFELSKRDCTGGSLFEMCCHSGVAFIPSSDVAGLLVKKWAVVLLCLFFQWLGVRMSNPCRVYLHSFCWKKKIIKHLAHRAFTARMGNHTNTVGNSFLMRLYSVVQYKLSCGKCLSNQFCCISIIIYFGYV